MKIYGDTNSGNCLKVKWVCDTLALPYDWISVDTLKGETRTTEFLKLNGAGQVPTVVFDDGRALAQSNAIIRYLARGSDLIPADDFAAAKMDEWLFWEQYSHEPYIAVCRFQMVYLGKPASDLDPDKIKRGYAALARMEHQLAATPFLVGDAVLARRRLAAGLYAAWRMRAASTSTAMPPCGAGSARPNGRSACRRRAEIDAEPSWPRIPSDHHPAARAATTSAPSWRCWRTIRSAARANGSKTRCRRPISGRSTASSAIRTSSWWSPRTARAPWSAACSSASCRD